VQNIFNYNQQLNPVYMPPLILKQLQYETDTWKRLLDFMMEENINLKIRLSEIIKDKFNKNALEDLEDFQSNFIKEDELISLLRNEVAELDKLFGTAKFDGGKISQEIEVKLERLRNNIIIAERQFGKLNLEFNNYLSLNM
jgi:hypothetical protein